MIQNPAPSLGHDFRLMFESAFNQEMVKWLETNIGKYDGEWAWGYHWNQDETDPSFYYEDITNSFIVTISFKSEKHATLFYLRWSDSCIPN